MRQRLFIWKGGESPLAITKVKKHETIDEYSEWVNRSQAMIITEYKGLTMADIDNLRKKMREAGGEFHVVKNTLGQIAFKQAGLPVEEKVFEGSTAIGFAFHDAPAVAKMIADYSRTSEFLKIKGGYLGKQAMTAADVRNLADLPPLPVMRATLLGVLNTPASRLARTLAEPGRQIASVVRAFSEKEGAPAPEVAA
jgi:large subunit ribosomal protein L10